jgi:hypothetical protein
LGICKIPRCQRLCAGSRSLKNFRQDDRISRKCSLLTFRRQDTPAFYCKNSDPLCACRTSVADGSAEFLNPVPAFFSVGRQMVRLL